MSGCGNRLGCVPAASSTGKRLYPGFCAVWLLCNPGTLRVSGAVQSRITFFADVPMVGIVLFPLSASGVSSGFDCLGPGLSALRTGEGFHTVCCTSGRCSFYSLVPLVPDG